MASGMQEEADSRPKPDSPSSAAATAASEDAESLENRLRAAEQQRDDYANMIRRMQADFENAQKRIYRDLTEERRYAYADFARVLLPIVDNLSRALDAGRQAGDPGPLIQGVSLVHDQLLDAFRRFGITPIGAEGESFDPTLHEAVSQEPRSDVAPNTVVRVLEPGYHLHDRLLRPARVVVSAPAES